MGFKCLVSDAEVFLLTHGGEYVILSKHVDDCLLAATKGSKLLNFVSSELAKCYTLTATIAPKNFAGLAISRNRAVKSITISEPHFVSKILDLCSVPTSSVKYPMSEDFLTSLKSTSELSLLPLPFKHFSKKKWAISSI